jgi:hypothetical protein
VDQKIGLSIRAALNEPDTEAVEAYFSSQGDGSATLGDLMDPGMFRKPQSEDAPGEDEPPTRGGDED